MKKTVVVLLMLILIISFQIFCKGGRDITGPIPVDPKADLVVVTAIYDEMNPKGGGYIHKLVLLDINNPENYTVISDTSYRPIYPTFSPDKSKILFLDRLNEWEDWGSQCMIYNFSEERFDTLLNNDNFGIHAESICWSNDGTSFFHSPYYAFPEWGTPVFKYDLFTKDNSVFMDRFPYRVYPACAINKDSLIVYSKDPQGTGETPGFYIVNSDGEYVYKLKCPNLVKVWNEGRYTTEARDLDWDSEKRLLVFAEFDPENVVTHISVTNLDGTYYKKYTEDISYHISPCWGPKENTIIFATFPKGTTQEFYSRLMILNTDSGEIRELIAPEKIDNAIGLKFPDF
ncbi:hypothetical protein ACFL7D_09545 [candidate division KSB1 bacterium]